MINRAPEPLSRNPLLMYVIQCAFQDAPTVGDNREGAVSDDSH
jgi:hypothetical protein